MLAATARLAAPERAVLALHALTEDGQGETAVALKLDQDAARDLRSRALEKLAGALSAAVEQAERRYGDWLWADPPDRLWQGLYEKFHREFQKQSRRSGLAGAAAAAVPAAAAAAARRLPGAGALLRLVRRAPRLAALAAVLLIAGGIATARSALEDSGTDGVPEAGFGVGAPGGGGLPGAGGIEQEEGGAGGGQGSDPLTPEELDELRREELADLERYGREQIDRDRRRGAAEERREPEDDAAGRRERQAQERRERARALEEERRARARERREQREADRRRDREPEPERQTPTEERPPATGVEPQEEPPPPPDERDCLYDEASRSYVCPE